MPYIQKTRKFCVYFDINLYPVFMKFVMETPGRGVDEIRTSLSGFKKLKNIMKHSVCVISIENKQIL
jgi:hypothetical protein